MSTQPAVATISLARSDQEAQVIHAALARLADGSRDVIVCDGGSGPAFVPCVAALPRVRVVSPVDGRGLLAQIQTSLRAALEFDTPFVLYTEPDKAQFFAAGLATFLAGAHAAAREGVVLAARSPASLGTFPDIQQYTEGVISRLCAEVTGVAGDYSYGPFLMHRSLAAEVLSIADDVGWGWRPFIFARASRLGQPVVLLPGDYSCPPDQRATDERLHRINQLQQNIRGLVLAHRGSERAGEIT